MRLLIVTKESYSTYHGIYKNNVYWLYNDYAKKATVIKVYNIELKSIINLISLPIANVDNLVGPITFLKVKDNYLIFNQVSDKEQKIVAYNIDNKNYSAQIALDSTVGAIYNADYEPDNENFALYYMALKSDGTDKNEAVGSLSVKTAKLLELFSLSENRYLNRERITISGKFIFYDILSNISGDITDHYTSVIYNYETHKRYERQHTFNTTLIDNNMYFLQFEKDSGANKTFFYKGKQLDSYK